MVDRCAAEYLAAAMRFSLFDGRYQGIIREFLFFLMPLPAGFQKFALFYRHLTEYSFVRPARNRE